MKFVGFSMYVGLLGLLGTKKGANEVMLRKYMLFSEPRPVIQE